MQIDSSDPTYTRIHSMNTPEGCLLAFRTDGHEVPVWDEFLDKISGSHFYQTSMWAEVRKLDGWQPLITLVTLNDDIMGGFQILVRSKKYFGKIGLLLKGPVCGLYNDGTIQFLLDTIKRIVIVDNIKALIVQPPDKDTAGIRLFTDSCFSPNYLESVIKTNTVITNLQPDETLILNAMAPKKRRNIKRAIRSGVTVHEGNENDIGTFFRFMLETCRRQRVNPNPSNEEFFRLLWKRFSARNRIKIFLAEHEGKELSAFVVLLFADTAYLWKFGWSGESREAHPNDLIYWEIFRWAKANGFLFADVGAIDPGLAHSLVNDSHVTEEMSRTYSYFKSGFGGNIIQLTNGFVHIPNTAIRLTYNLFMPCINRIPFLKRKLLLQ